MKRLIFFCLILTLTSSPCLADGKYFTGKTLDEATKVYHMGAREYDPEIGRFLQPDTIVQNPMNPQTLNRYAYCGNNPINRIDPSGYSFKSFFHKYGFYLPIASPWFIWGGLNSSIVQYAVTGDANQLGRNAATLTLAAVGGAAWGAHLSMAQYAMVGAGLGGAGSAISGGDIYQGMLYGVVGGLLIRAGGALMAQKFFGAGIIGNVVQATGQSSIENLFAGQPAMSRIQVFFGPLSVSMGAGMKPQFGMSTISSLYYSLAGIIGPAKIKLWDTVSSGTMVFDDKEHGFVPWKLPGITKGNVIFLNPTSVIPTQSKSIDGFLQYVTGHERIHANMQGRFLGSVYGNDIVEIIAQSRGTYFGTTPTSLYFEYHAGSFPLWGK